MFQGHVGREYWQGARQDRLSSPATRSERRFHEILDVEYRRAQPRISPPETDRTPRMEERLFWTVFGAAAVMLYRALSRRARR
jgi:hypothetical protein